jgi:hypothetical protein
MSCADIQRRLHDEPQLGRTEEAIAEHLADCAACRGVFEQLAAIGPALKAAPLPELPAGFEFALRRRLAEEARSSTIRPAQERRQGGTTLRWLALAATLAAVVIGGALVWRAAGPQRDATTYHQLALTVRAEAALPQARFEVFLPEGFSVMPELASTLGAGRHLSWSSDVARGSTRFALPLKSMIRKGDVVRVRISVGGRSIERQIPLRVKTAGRRGAPIQLAMVIKASEVLR